MESVISLFLSLCLLKFIILIFLISPLYSGHCSGTFTILALESPQPHFLILDKVSILSLTDLTLYKLDDIFSKEVLNLFGLQDVLDS